MTSTPAYEPDDDLARLIREQRASRLRKAGLRGSYQTADCSLGREMYQRALEGRGTYLWGLTGRGKTYAACCCVRLAIDAGSDARFTTAKGLLDDLKAEYDGYGSGTLRRAEGCDILALDDLGVERPTDWAMETLTGLIDARVADGLPTIVTSNFSLGELRERWGGVQGARIASRIGGACERVEVTGPDRRLQ
jgi:DNA replication protein DnaC